MELPLERLERRRLLSTWYVSATGGSDANAGTLNLPWQTIQQAASAAQPGDTVIIRAGTYRETVVPAHSGTAAAPITYEAYPGEQVTIDGADPVTGWTPSSSGAAVYGAPMPWDLGNGQNQVFFDGQMVNEARWPNSGTDLSHPNLALTTSATVKVGSNGLNTATIGVPLNDPAGAWVGATIHISPGQAWVTQTGTVIASAPGSLTYQYQPLTPFEVPTAGNHFYLTGLFRALDAPDEWFRDAAGNLYLQAPQNADPTLHLVEAKRRLNAFDLSGLSYTYIVGLNLFACTINTSATSANDVIDGVSARYISHQTINPYPWAAQDPPHTTGILLNGSGDVIQNSTIRDSSGDGIYLGGTGDAALNNVVADADYAAGEEAGITDFGPGNQVLGNTVYNCGRSGIVFRHCPNSLIAHNVVHDVGIQETDLGGIYTYGGNTQGTEVAYNVVYNVHSGGFGAAGIYLDNNAIDLTVDHNVVYNCDFALKMNPPCDDIQVYNNTLVGTQDSVASTNGEEMTGSVFANNIFTAPTQIGATATQTNNLSAPTDPQFVNAAAGNYQLSPTSPAIDAGITEGTFTAGYAGAAPDLGAYEFGQPAFAAGSTLPAAAPPPPPLTIWSPGAGPAPNQQNVFDPTIAPAGGVELGLKFTADVAGYVDGVRFYKGTRNVGPHTGELWSASGQLLASISFNDETASGWQQANFASPVPIWANATYIVSYQDTSGFLAYTGGALAMSGVDAPPLHALASPASGGGNSVYQPDATPGTPAFPATYNGHAANYWVDVAFGGQGTPAPPASVAAVVSAAAAPATVTVSWSASAGAVTAFHLERSTDGMHFSEIAANLSSTSYVDAAAQPGMSYTYRVRAENAGLFSGYATATTISTPGLPPVAPAAPTGFTASIMSGQVVLNWSAPASGMVTAYHVERSSDGVNFTELAGQLQGTSYVDASVQPGQTYAFRLRAENAGAFSPYAGPQSLTLAPSAPAGLSIAAITPASVSLSWTASPGATQYELLRQGPSDAAYVMLATTPSTSFVDQPVQPATTYAYEVVAVNAGGASPPAIVMASTPGVPPSAPAFLSAVAWSPTQVGLVWPPVSQATAYHVERSADGVHFAEIVANLSTPGYLDSVAPDATYWYRVRAENAGSYSAYTEANQLTMAPLPPSHLTANASPASIALAWSPPPAASGAPDPNVVGYNIYRAAGPAGPFTQLNTAPLPQTSFSDAAAPAGRASYYQVVAVGTAQAVSSPALASAARPALGPSISLWGSAAAPAPAQQNVYDPLAAAAHGVELGLRFHLDVSGYVTGVRFWKGSRDTGVVHTGELWTAGGQLLAAATFTHETANGWQQVSFSQPVPIAANTVYVVSYQDPAGYLAYTPGVLANQVSDGPLHTAVGGNGVYHLDRSPGTPAFPIAFNGKACSYWVDVLFSPVI